MTRSFLSWFFLLSMMPELIAEAQTPNLPCANTSAECVATLGDMAVNNSLELQTLNRAIAYQQKKVWSAWMNADGWNPLAVGMRIVRNVVGGGDRAAIKLEIANLERRGAEVESALRLQVSNALADIEVAGRRRQFAQSKLDNHLARVQLIEVGYRLGDGSTEEMLMVWSTGVELRGQVAIAESDAQMALLRLEAVVSPMRLRVGVAQVKLLGAANRIAPSLEKSNMVPG